MRLLNLIKRRAAPKQPEVTTSALPLIRELYKAGSYNATVLVCDQALTLESTNAEVYLTRGLAKYKLGDLSGAARDMKQAAGVIRQRTVQKKPVY